MKTFSVLVLGVVVGLCAVSRVDAAVQYGRGNDRARGDQVCVYKDINYQGAEQCYSAGDEINNLGSPEQEHFIDSCLWARDSHSLRKHGVSRPFRTVHFRRLRSGAADDGGQHRVERPY